MTDDLLRRRQWFDRYLKPQGGVTETGESALFTCPCCGYPTLHSHGSYEICSLCYWEDDGQDDPYADDVRGGPNHGYSLSEARANFQRHLTMYDPSDTTRTPKRPDNARVVEAKRLIIAAFESLMNASEPPPVRRLTRDIARGLAVLDEELYLRAFENPPWVPKRLWLLWARWYARRLSRGWGP